MRKAREIRKGSKYHVIARINRKEMVLKNDDMKALLLHTVIRAKKIYSFAVENFVIMGNHFHLIIYPGQDENLSRIMQWILFVFAKAYNRKICMPGHVWGDRFFSRILKNFREYITTFGYIDRNPSASGLVKKMTEWHFSGLFFHRSGFHDPIEKPRLYVLLQLPLHHQLQIGRSAGSK
jgi:REP element-mobilizing transposase RayT